MILTWNMPTVFQDVHTWLHEAGSVVAGQKKNNAHQQPIKLVCHKLPTKESNLHLQTETEQRCPLRTVKNEGLHMEIVEI